MTLHEKILGLNNLGFDIKFDRFASDSFAKGGNTYLVLRYHGHGSVKVENSRMVTQDQFKNESFVVSELQRLYEEMKHHAYGDKSYYLPEC